MKRAKKKTIEGPRTAYGYCRVSSKGQAERGMSLEAQQEMIHNYYEFKLRPDGWRWGGYFTDGGRSAWRKNLDERKAGRSLMMTVKAGDCVIFTKFDRAFRNLVDCCRTIESLQEKHVDVELLQINLDTSTPIGRLIMHVLAAVAEFESSLRSERVREVFNNMRLEACKRGEIPYLTGQAPHGIIYERDAAGRRIAVEDEWKRMVGGIIVDARERGLSWMKIQDLLWEKEIYPRKTLREKGKKIRFNDGYIVDLYKKELQRRAYDEMVAEQQKAMGKTD